VDLASVTLMVKVLTRSLDRAVREVLDLIVGRSSDFYLCLAPVGENPSHVTNRRIVNPAIGW
jgi:hypothetical protein